jgi:hypothetical protein
MRRTVPAVVLVSALAAAPLALSISGLAAPPKPPGAATTAATSDAPVVNSLTSYLDGFTWGQTHAQITDAYNKLNGIFDREYAPVLAKMQPGPRMQDVVNDSERRKAAFANSYVPFRDTPTGFDTTPIKTEYSYRNNEAVQWVFRAGVKRYFFFIGAPPTDRMWKIYDEIPLKDDGPLGKTFQEAIAKLNASLGVPGRLLPADAAHGRPYATVEWQDQTTHMRALDRSSEDILAFVREERTTLNNLGSLRANKPVDPFALDPSIAAITKNGVSDPNAPQPATSSSSKPKNRGQH